MQPSDLPGQVTESATQPGRLTISGCEWNERNEKYLTEPIICYPRSRGSPRPVSGNDMTNYLMDVGRGGAI